MEKKHYIQIAICSLVILIAVALFNFYYQTYIAPESYVIGSVKYEDYKELAIKDYISDDEVIFSQNINDVTFAKVDSTATYEYNFDTKQFNGIEKDYIIYVNNYMINSLEENAGTIGGTYNLNYYDTEKQVLCSSDINIDFSFYSLRSVLKVTLNYSDLGYLMKYFESDNFIITLTENPYSMMSKDGEVDEKIQEIVNLTNKVNELNSEIAGLNTEISQHLQDIAELTQSNEDNTAEIERLKTELADIQAEADSLTTDLANANSELARLEAENIEIIAENADLKALVETQKTTIAQLEQTISDLQYQVSYYEQLLEEYQNIEKLSVSFRVDSEAIDVQLVESGEFAIVPVTPTKVGYKFLGWSIDGTNVVEVETYSIIENTVFIALFKEVNKNGTFANDEHTLVFENDELISWTYNGTNRAWGTNYKGSLYYAYVTGAQSGLDYTLMFYVMGFDEENDCWIFKTGPSSVDVSELTVTNLIRVN